MIEQVKIANAANIVAICEKVGKTGLNIENSFAALQKRVRLLDIEVAKLTVENIDLRNLISLLGPALGNLLNEHAYFQHSDKELKERSTSPLVGDMCAHLLEARESYAEYLAHNPEQPAEITSDDFEPVENWRPERDI